VQPLAGSGFDVDPSPHIVADDEPRIAELLIELVDAGHRLIVTTGGTGLTPGDVTPAATRRVIDREVPGMAEQMRAAGLANTPMASLSRGLVGTRGQSLIVNLPGSPKGATESLEALLPVLRHAIEQLGGGDH
jgi:molybdenum cofactor synthesis domain-containing protein